MKTIEYLKPYLRRLELFLEDLYRYHYVLLERKREALLDFFLEEGRR